MHAVKNHSPPESFSHSFTENTSYKIHLGAACSLFGLNALLLLHANKDFCLRLGLVTSLCQFNGGKTSAHMNMRRNLNSAITPRKNEKAWGGLWLCKMTDRPREVWTRSVTKVEVAGHTQLRANMAYLNSSSHTTWSEKKQIWSEGLSKR